MDDYIRDVAVPQVRELLSNYGPLAILWWDTPVDMTKERAEKFEHVTHRTMVAPSGKYSLQATERFGLSFKMEDGEGKTLAPLDGDWKGELKSGVIDTDLAIVRDSIANAAVPAGFAGFLVAERFIGYVGLNKIGNSNEYPRRRSA